MYDKRITTFIAEVVDKQYLLEELRRCSVDDRVNGPQQRAPALVVEHYDDAGLGQVRRVVPVLASVN